MTTDLTRRQADVLAVIDAFWRVHGYSPSLTELMDATGIGTPNGIVSHLQALRRKGWVTYLDGKKRTLRLVKREDYDG